MIFSRTVWRLAAFLQSQNKTTVERIKNEQIRIRPAGHTGYGNACRIGFQSGKHSGTVAEKRGGGIRDSGKQAGKTRSRFCDPSASGGVLPLFLSGDHGFRLAILTTQKGTASYLFFPVKPGIRFATTYLYAQNDAPIIGRLYLDQTEGATRVEVKDFKVAKLTEEELAGNLFPDGEFENGTGADFLKTNSNNSKPVVGEIVPSPDFFAGEKSLELAFGNPGVENKLATHYLPMIPGKKMQLKFWAKSTGKHKLTVIMNTIPRIGAVHKGKHLFLTKPFTLDEEWKEYTLTFVPGENYDAVPDLKCHLLKLQFFTPEKESGKIWLDNVDYRILEVK